MLYSNSRQPTLPAKNEGCSGFQKKFFVDFSSKISSMAGSFKVIGP